MFYTNKDVLDRVEGFVSKVVSEGTAEITFPNKLSARSRSVISDTFEGIHINNDIMGFEAIIAEDIYLPVDTSVIVLVYQNTTEIELVKPID